MIRLGVITLLLITSIVVGCVSGCSDACETLVEETCARHGEDSLTCMSRSRELESRSSAHTRLCERALMLMRSLPESEQE